jgi:hypothetical protein
MAESLADQIAHFTQLVDVYRRRLQALEIQQATYGSESPPHIITEKRDAERNLQQAQVKLAHLQAQAERQKEIEVASDNVTWLLPSADTAPFVVGPPVLHPRAFFGRERIVKRVFELLRHPPLQNTVIIGSRRSGKTSLLHYLRAITQTPSEQLRPNQRNDWLLQPENYRWLLVDFQDGRYATRAGFMQQLLNGLRLSIPQPCTLDRFMDVATQGIRTPTVILLDEIGKALQHYHELDDDIWESLRALGPQTGGQLGFVLATHTSPVELAHASGRSSPFLNIFGYTAMLGPFNEAEARALIASAPLPIPEADVEWILQQSGRWPILLQALCRERWASLNEGDDSDDWRAEGLRQIAPYRHLLGTDEHNGLNLPNK